MHYPKSILFNITFVLNCLLAFLLLFDSQIMVPGWLQVVGRMHPLILHFPIVLLVLCIFWELFMGFRQNDRAANIKIGDALLISAALASVTTALMGLFLSKEEGYTPDVLVWHKWSGVAISFLLLAWYAYRSRIRKHKAAMIVSSFVAMVVIVITGHQGSNITHGENFLLAPVMQQNEITPVLFEDAMVYADVVHPILELKCVSCHNSKKAKGDLVMESSELLLKGGKNGDLWDSTDNDLGLLMRRIHLPEEHKKHMPPLGKPQLTNEEVEILYRWIKSGARFDTRLADLPVIDTLRIIAATKFENNKVESYDFAAADDDKIKKLNNEYRIVNPIAKGSPGLTVEFFGIAQYKPEQLKELLDIKNQVVWLNLNKMPVKDEDLKIIGQFSNLRKLNLSFTNITGATLKELAQLKELNQLSVSGTKIQKQYLKNLAPLTNLNELFIWNTPIESKDIAGLQKQFKNVHIETGFAGDTIILQLTPPIIENEEVVITQPVKLKLKHYINGVSIRYTTDGSEPDSLTSSVYKGNVDIAKNLTIKTKAFKPGWISSNIATKAFFRSALKPDSVILLTKTNEKFAADGGKTIIDGQKGELNFKGGKWLGYREQRMEALLCFNEPKEVSSITISGLIDINSFIMPPKSIEVWGGNQVGKMKLIKTITPEQPTKTKPSYITGYDVTFNPIKEKFIKLVITPLPKLPTWHIGKGDKAWWFTDEIFVN